MLSQYENSAKAQKESCGKKRTKLWRPIPCIKLGRELHESIKAQALEQIHLIKRKCILLLHTTPPRGLILQRHSSPKRLQICKMLQSTQNFESISTYTSNENTNLESEKPALTMAELQNWGGKHRRLRNTGKTLIPARRRFGGSSRGCRILPQGMPSWFDPVTRLGGTCLAHVQVRFQVW